MAKQTHPSLAGSEREHTLTETCAKLLEHVAQGDREAFAQLYDLTASRFYGLALRVVREATLAEEAVQEAYLAVWQQASHYEASRGSALGWMTTICHRRCVDKVRSEEGERARRAAMEELATTPQDEMAEQVCSAIAAQDVHDALLTLPTPQILMVTSVYFGGLSIPQAAEALSVPVGTAKTRLRDGLHKLKKEIRREDHV